MTPDPDPPTAREEPSLADWVVIALSPVLIMLMVGSLVFFLIEVLYQGKYGERLLYTMFFFVAAAVLVARISIEQGGTKAALYGIVLAGATLVAMQAFVEYPTPALRAFGTVINLALMALVWWAANKLTWDCTHVDEARKASGRGILSAAGLEETANPEPEPEAETGKKPKKKKPAGFFGWMSRFEAHREAKRKKPHTPGVWVVYFALAAIPLFALGQSLVPADDDGRRRATFLQMVVYVGSGLGLLVTTSLLGVRKYLRERNARIPAAMTLGWLGVGGALIVFFLVAGSLLPRPHSETPWLNLPQSGKQKRQASKNAVVKDGSAGEGQGAAGKKTEAGDGKNSAKGGKQSGGKAGEKGSGGGKGKDSGGKGKDGDKGKNDDDKGEKSDDAKGNNAKQSDDAKRQGKDAGDKGGQSEDAKKDAEGEAADADQSNGDTPPESQISKTLETAAGWVKWLVWVVVAVAVVVGGVIFVLKFLAPFTAWARNLLDWFRGLFARKARTGKASGNNDSGHDIAAHRPTPFASFSNPFADGSAENRDVEELARYTFAAFDSWAWDRAAGRGPGETPGEFAARIGAAFPDLGEPGRRLANLYARVLYANTDPPANALEILEAFWDAVEQPVSAAGRD